MIRVRRKEKERGTQEESRDNATRFSDMEKIKLDSPEASTVCKDLTSLPYT